MIDLLVDINDVYMIYHVIYNLSILELQDGILHDKHKELSMFVLQKSIFIFLFCLSFY